MRVLFLFLLGFVTVGLFAQKDEPTKKDMPNFDKMWNHNDPAATEKRFNEILPDAESCGNIGYHAELLTQIARSQGLQGKFKKANATLESCKKLLPDCGHRAQIRYNLEMGRVLNSSGKPDESKKYFKDAWELAEKNNELSLAIDAAHMMGIVTPPEKQLEWSEKAIELAENSDDPAAQSWLGPLYNNTGWSYHELGRYEKSLEIWRKGLELRKKIGSKPEIFVAKWIVGRGLRSLDKREQALEIQKEILKEREEAGLPPDGYVHEELGELYLLEGEVEKAQKHFAKAYKLISQDKWMMQNEKERMQRIKELGKVD